MVGIWRVVVGVLLACLLGVGGWTVARTATMPDRHPTREEFTGVRESINRIDEKIDRIIDYLMEGK